MAATHTRQPSLVDMAGDALPQPHRPPRGEPSWLSWLHRSHLGKDGWGTAISAIYYGWGTVSAAILRSMAGDNSMAAVRLPRHTHKWLRACRPRPRGTAAIGCHRIITSHGSGGWLQSLCPSHSRWLKWLKWLSPSHLTQDGCDIASSAMRARPGACGMAAVVRLQPSLLRMAALCVLQPSAWRLWLRCS